MEMLSGIEPSIDNLVKQDSQDMHGSGQDIGRKIQVREKIVHERIDKVRIGQDITG